MFSTEFNGYNKEEVDRYIARLKAEHEASLMQEKLKVLESEKKLLDFKNHKSEIETRERNIMSALEAFRNFQEEGTSNIKTLHYEQIRMINEELHVLFKEICMQFPGIQSLDTFNGIFNDLEHILSQAQTPTHITSLTQTDNDSMRILLNKMQGYRREQESPKEVRIVRVEDLPRRNQIKPIYDGKLEEGDSYATLADKFLSTKPEENARSLKPQESGFDLKEAINPKDDLAEIMKAFDFFNDAFGEN